MLSYVPGETLAHRLDPRTKLLFQAGVAVAAFTHPTAAWIGGLTALALLVLLAARLSPLDAFRAYWFVLVVLAFGPVIAGVRLGPPWFAADAALRSLLSVGRLVPVLLVSAAYVHSTPVRETRAAIQWLVPGRAGQVLGVGVGLTVRFVPVVRRDVGEVRAAVAARGGDRRSLRDRLGRIGFLSAARALDRADRLATALKARCFAWNPTLPALSIGRRDVPVLLLGLGLAVSPLVSV
ncbi:MAG: energy-coupling factor transporter transmembrane component T [Haloarculaceae archaeon]